MIKKAIIPSAGLGTRLLPATKEQPKEMLPIFTKNFKGELCLKPILHIVFENLYSIGLREFGFITGRGKRSVEDYFTIDSEYVAFLKKRNSTELAKELTIFYEKISNSQIAFINQPKPLGFGEAVHRAKFFTGKEPFLVHAGDDLIISNKSKYLLNLCRIFEKYEADAAFCVEKVKDPRNYGVIISDKIAKNVYKVRKVFEKPRKPPSNIAIVAVYVFTPNIYKAIEETKPDISGELQLTNAIQKLIDRNLSVYAMELETQEKRLDIGNPQSYLEALQYMLKY